MDQVLPNDVLNLIGLTCWPAFKSMFLVNKLINRSLKKYNLSKMFYREIDKRNGKDYNVNDYYKCVVSTCNSYVDVYFDGKMKSRYLLLQMVQTDHVQISNKKRYKYVNGSVYTEIIEFPLPWGNPSYIYVERVHEGENFIQRHSIYFEIESDDIYVRYKPMPYDSGKLPDEWLVTLAEFFVYDS